MKFTTKHQISSILFFLSLTGFISFTACNGKSKAAPEKEIVSTPEKMDKKLPDVIQSILKDAAANKDSIPNAILLNTTALTTYLYQQNDNKAYWCKEEQWTAPADSLMQFIKNCMLYGLFPQDYNNEQLQNIKDRFAKDTAAIGDKKDAVLWAKADVILTDAFAQIISDVKIGHLPKDSISYRKDSALSNEFILEKIKEVTTNGNLTSIINQLEPKHKGYQELKKGIARFLDSAVFTNYTYVPFPVYDSAKYRIALQKRLSEIGLIASPDSGKADSIHLANAVKAYQQKIKVKADGKAGGETVRSLNNTDKNKFAKIAITLDKYKLLPDTMPERYVWVNLPSYYMQLIEEDTVRLVSKVVVGKPLTRTPELNSAISEIITYPQWTIPQSIIAKEILPALKRNPGYLARKGFSLLNSKNEEVDPWFVDWSRYKTGIPFRVVQGSGDANALGVMKFNFPNKYAVYLHDTNQRSLFGSSSRAFSHGCVRVQEWQKLANFIIQNDSTVALENGNTNFVKVDSITTWLKRKEKHTIPVKNKIPVFIRYFTCAGKDGRIIFYDDIYNEDRKLQEKYFAGK